jgi:hypothetical protein
MRLIPEAAIAPWNYVTLRFIVKRRLRAVARESAEYTLGLVLIRIEVGEDTRFLLHFERAVLLHQLGRNRLALVGRQNGIEQE